MRTYHSLPCLVFFALLLSCGDHEGHETKDELLKFCEHPKLKNFVDSEIETKDYTVHRMTNMDAQEYVDLSNAKEEVVLQYTAMKKRDSETICTKTILERKPESARLAVVDLKTGKPSWEKEFPVKDSPRDSLSLQNFSTLQACIDDFMCKHQCEFEQLANKTCEAQFVGITCCLANNQCFSVHLVFQPTSIRCLILPPFDFPVYFKGVMLPL